MADEISWSEQADGFLIDLSKTTQEKYGFDLRQLLLDPENAAKQKEIQQQVKNSRNVADGYFSSLLDTLKDERVTLNKALEAADALYVKLDEVVTNKTAVSRVPYIKPVLVDADPDRQEEIVIEQYTGNVDLLITKLIEGTTYVGNLSTTYQKYNMGSWVFSGRKTYLLTINPPTSVVVTVENARDEIAALIDGLEGIAKPASSK